MQKLEEMASFINKLPTGANNTYQNTKRLTIGTFKKSWLKMTSNLQFPGTEAGNEVTYGEWEEDDKKFQGMRKNGIVKHGIVR